MTIIIEISRPILWKPDIFIGEIVFRVGWLFVSVAIMRGTLDEIIKELE